MALLFSHVGGLLAGTEPCGVRGKFWLPLLSLRTAAMTAKVVRGHSCDMLSRGGGDSMSTRAIGANELSWMILEELREAGISPMGIAVIPGRTRSDWRVVVHPKSREYMKGNRARRLAAIEERLRSLYAVAD